MCEPDQVAADKLLTWLGMFCTQKTVSECKNKSWVKRFKDVGGMLCKKGLLIKLRDLYIILI